MHYIVLLFSGIIILCVQIRVNSKHNPHSKRYGSGLSRSFYVSIAFHIQHNFVAFTWNTQQIICLMFVVCYPNSFNTQLDDFYSVEIEWKYACVQIWFQSSALNANTLMLHTYLMHFITYAQVILLCYLISSIIHSAWCKSLCKCALLFNCLHVWVIPV